MIAYWISEVAQNRVAPAGQRPAYPSGVCLGELLGSASDQQHQEAGEDASCCFQMCTAYVAMLPFHLDCLLLKPPAPKHCSVAYAQILSAVRQTRLTEFPRAEQYYESTLILKNFH